MTHFVTRKKALYVQGPCELARTSYKAKSSSSLSYSIFSSSFSNASFPRGSSSCSIFFIHHPLLPVEWTQYPGHLRVIATISFLCTLSVPSLFSFPNMLIAATHHPRHPYLNRCVPRCLYIPFFFTFPFERNLSSSSSWSPGLQAIHNCLYLPP